MKRLFGALRNRALRQRAAAAHPEIHRAFQQLAGRPAPAANATPAAGLDRVLSWLLALHHVSKDGGIAGGYRLSAYLADPIAKTSLAATAGCFSTFPAAETLAAIDADNALQLLDLALLREASASPSLAGPKPQVILLIHGLADGIHRYGPTSERLAGLTTLTEAALMEAESQLAAPPALPPAGAVKALLAADAILPDAAYQDRIEWLVTRVAQALQDTKRTGAAEPSARVEWLTSALGDLLAVAAYRAEPPAATAAAACADQLLASDPEQLLDDRQRTSHTPEPQQTGRLAFWAQTASALLRYGAAAHAPRASRMGANLIDRLLPHQLLGFRNPLLDGAFPATVPGPGPLPPSDFLCALTGKYMADALILYQQWATPDPRREERTTI